MDAFAWQTGLIVAVIAAGLIVASRIGGTDEVARRFFQIVLALMITFTVVAGTTAFLRGPDAPDSSGIFSGDDDEEQSEYIKDLNNRNSVAASIHVVAGVVATVAGVTMLRKQPTTALAVLTGGLLLILLGGPQGGGSTGDLTSLYTSLLGSVFSLRSMGIDIAHFIALAGGLILLLAVGRSQFDADEEPVMAQDASA